MKFFSDGLKFDFELRIPEVFIFNSLEHSTYSPIDRDEVYKDIFEQAENFKKYSP